MPDDDAHNGHPTADTPYQWWYTWGTEFDGPAHGPEDTREAIIALAESELDKGESFTIVHTRHSPIKLDAAAIIDKIAQDADDEGVWGDDGFEDFVGGEERHAAATAALQEALNSWFEAHGCHIFKAPWTLDDFDPADEGATLVVGGGEPE